MPIKGKTDGEARWPVIGKLRKGGERGPNGEMGKELAYFRFTPTTKDPEMAKVLLAAFQDAYGRQPAKLDVILPYSGIDLVFPTWMEEWGKSGLVHRCDGETMEIWLDGKGYSRAPKPCPYATGEKQRSTSNPGCKQIGRLFVALPELVKAGYSGIVVVETHSDHDLRHIDGVLKAIRGTNGLMGVPCVLWREQTDIPIPNYKGEGRVMAKKWLIRIAPMAEYMAKQVAAMNRLALADESTVVVTPSGRRVDAVTGEIMEPSEEAWGEEDVEEGDFASEMAEEHGATVTKTEEPKTEPAKANGNGKVELRYLPDGSPACPTCGKAMWDNREKKASPRAPDFKCKDKACGGVYWPNQWHPKAGNGNGDGKPVNVAGMLNDLSARMKKLPMTWGNFGEAVKKTYQVTSAAGLTEPQIAEINCKLDVLEKIAAVKSEMAWDVENHPVEFAVEYLNDCLKWLENGPPTTEGEGA